MKPQRTFIGNEGDYSVDNRGPEALKKDTDALMKMFDPSSTHENGESGGIGADNLKTDFTAELPVKDKDGMATKLQLVLNMIYDALANTYSKLEADAKIAEETSNLVGAVDYESGTGVFKIKNKGGEIVKTYDTPIEKIPANFKLAAIDNKIYLVVTNEDGTSTRTNVSSLIDTVSVKAADGDPILVSLSQSTTPEDETQQVSKTFTLSIQDASLNMSKFAPDVVAKFKEVKTNAISAAAYASKAAQSAESAQNSANGAFFFKDKADQIHAAVIQEKEIIDTLKTEVESARNQADSAANLSKSYAVGGAGSRENEDTDNAKYYAEQAAESAANAAASAGGDYVTNPAFNEYKQNVTTELAGKAPIEITQAFAENFSLIFRKSLLGDGTNDFSSPYLYWTSALFYQMEIKCHFNVGLNLLKKIIKKLSSDMRSNLLEPLGEPPAPVTSYDEYPHCKTILRDEFHGIIFADYFPNYVEGMTQKAANDIRSKYEIIVKFADEYLDMRMSLYNVAMRDEIYCLYRFIGNLPKYIPSVQQVIYTNTVGSGVQNYLLKGGIDKIDGFTLPVYLKKFPETVFDIYTVPYGVEIENATVDASTGYINIKFKQPLAQQTVVKVVFNYQVRNRFFLLSEYNSQFQKALYFGEFDL